MIPIAQTAATTPIKRIDLDIIMWDDQLVGPERNYKFVIVNLLQFLKCILRKSILLISANLKSINEYFSNNLYNLVLHKSTLFAKN